VCRAAWRTVTPAIQCRRRETADVDVPPPHGSVDDFDETHQDRLSGVSRLSASRYCRATRRVRRSQGAEPRRMRVRNAHGRHDAWHRAIVERTDGDAGSHDLRRMSRVRYDYRAGRSRYLRYVRRPGAERMATPAVPARAAALRDL